MDAREETSSECLLGRLSNEKVSRGEQDSLGGFTFKTFGRPYFHSHLRKARVMPMVNRKTELFGN
jgi:hypothetical protein